MAIFETNPVDFLKVKKGEKTVKLIKKEIHNGFNEDILGLGKIDIKSKQINALAVMFDLESFTVFCKQIDPQLVVSEYLSEFLKWLFSRIRQEVIHEEFEEGYNTYCGLPFLSKYLGDGVLFLWDTEQMSDIQIINLVISMHEISSSYVKEFLPRISKKVASPPTKLRCGIARGAIYSVGNGNDFVGPCINMASRLQKLHSLSFCFSRRGFAYEVNNGFSKAIEVKKVNIRGIGEEELVCVLKSEFLKLSDEEKSQFTNM